MRRISAILLAFLLLCPLFPASFAEGEERVQIGSAEDFLRFAAACAEESYSAGRAFELTADLDLSNTACEPVPYFAGRFFGNHRLITLTDKSWHIGLDHQVFLGHGLTIESAPDRGTTVRVDLGTRKIDIE